MRLLLLIPLLSFSVLVVMAGNGKRVAPKMEELEAQAPKDPDAAKIQAEVKYPPTKSKRAVPGQPTCVDVNGNAWTPSDSAFEACRQDSVNRTTASGVPSSFTCKVQGPGPIAWAGLSCAGAAQRV